MELLVTVPVVYVRPLLLLWVGVMEGDRRDKAGFTGVGISGSGEEEVSTEKIILRCE